jgi:hypothetical protein
MTENADMRVTIGGCLKSECAGNNRWMTENADIQMR